MSQHENELEELTDKARDWYRRDKVWAPSEPDGTPTYTYTPPDTDAMPDVSAGYKAWTDTRHAPLTGYIERLEAKREWLAPEAVVPLPESAVRIARECDRIKAFLIEKNLAYGNSALQPVRIFSEASTVEQLLVRIDDKLSRMENGFEHGDDDTTLDLIGYLILLRVALNGEEA